MADKKVSKKPKVNNKGQIESIDEVLFYFDGSDIEVDTLIESLNTFKKVCQEIMDKAEPEKKLALTVKGVDRGSVIIDYGIALIDTVKQTKAFAPDAISYAANFVQTVAGIYALAAWLRGRKPKKVKEQTKKNSETYVQVENNSGLVQNFDLRGANIYLQDSQLQEIIAQNFKTLDSDKRVKSFEIRDKKGKALTKINRDTFSEISRKDIEEDEGVDENKIKTEKVETTLPIKGQDWELKKGWEFYYNGIKITAKILDTTFKKKIEEGERFAKGDSLVVELEIKKEFDQTIGVFINKSYAITKIKEHIKRGAAIQGKLFVEKPERKKKKKADK